MVANVHFESFQVSICHHFDARMNSPSSEGGVLSVGDGVQPGTHVDRGLGGDADVSELAVGTRTVPMVGVGWADDDIAGMEDLDLLAADLVVTHTSGGQEDLPMRMVVPAVAATGGESDVVHAHIDGTDLVGVKELGQPHRTGEVGTGGVEASSEYFRICHDSRIVPHISCSVLGLRHATLAFHER